MKHSFALMLLCLISYQSFASAFITTWQSDNSDSNNDPSAITIPTTGGGYNYDIYWESTDDAGINGTVTGVTGTIDLDFDGEEGEFRVEITGDFPRIYFNGMDDAAELIAINQWGDIQWTSMEDAFNGCTELTYAASDAPNLTGVTNLREMFRDASSFNGDLSDWDVSTITNMNSMFRDADSFNGNITTWNVTAVEDFKTMFRGASSFNQDISEWKLISATGISSMFYNANAFNQNIGEWDVSKVTSFSSVFRGASSFNQDISGWKLTSATSLSSFLRDASSFNQSLGALDISTITNLTNMLNNTAMSTENYDNTLTGWAALTLQPGETIDVSGLTYCSAASARDQIISNFSWTFSGDAEATRSSATFVTTEPTDMAVCGLSQTTIAADVSGTGLSFQWQENTGGGFTNVSEGGDYTGVTSTSLTIGNIQSKVGNVYRLLITSSACEADTSNSSTIFNSILGTSVWTGAIDTDWSECGNWSNGLVPTNANDAQITTAGSSPVIGSGTSSVQNLTFDSGAMFTMADGATLDIYGNITNDNNLTLTTGTIQFRGSSLQNVAGGGTYSLYNVTANNSNFVVFDADVNISGALTINSSTFLNTGKTVTLKSTASGTGLLVENATFTKNGNFICERFINQNSSFGNSSAGSRYITSPVSSATVSEINDDQSLIITHPYSTKNGGDGNATDPFPNMFYYNESLFSTVDDGSSVGWETPASLSESMPIGRGYNLRTSSGITLDITGTPNNGDQSVIVTNTLGDASSGFNLIGNPYPSPIDWDLVYADNSSDIGSTIWLRNATSQYGGSFITYNAGSQITVPSAASYDGKVAMMQGFFVQNPSAGAAVVNFSNTHRVTTHAAEVFYREEAPKPQVLLQLTGSDNYFDEIAVYTDDNATDGVEKEFDSEMFQYNSLPNPTLYTIVEDKNIKINGIPTPEQNKVIPLGMYLPKNGNFTFSVNELIAGNEDLKMFLEDMQTGELVELDKNATYSFSGDKGTVEERFNIIIQPKTSVITDNIKNIQEEVSIYPNPAINQITITLINSYIGDYNVSIVDMQGKEVSSSSFEKTQNRTSFNTNLDLASGIYFIHLTPTQGGNTVVQKLIIQ
ncbi:MAG: BspA family leucine-rich repeat surface protein [Cytophagales bacterium]|nr:BspA family leucine-rich repeat surface protein [Cytophagales bacterium]